MTRHIVIFLFAAVIAWIAGCGADMEGDYDPTLFTPDPAGEETPTETPTETPADPAAPDPEPGDEEPPPECGAVDILFVIDNSGSMADNQRSLIASFPGFVAGMRERLAYADSFHVGVVTTDAYRHNAPGCTAIGSLVTQTGGPESSGMVCSPFTSGARYMDQTEYDLAAAFACAAQVGAGGDDDERAMAALLGALSPAANAPGGCNDGFLRDDALLVVVVISDEDDVPDVCDLDGVCETYGSGGTPDEWFEAVVNAKGGYPQNAVVLSLVGLRGDNPCGAVPAAKLIGFANRFGENGYVGDVCADSYEAFFTEVLPIIDEACENFVLI